VNPAQTTTYHVRGEPGCDGPLPCAIITVNVGTDVTPPTISCPANQVVTGDANCSAILADYTGQAVVEDDCDLQPSVSQSPAPGTAFNNFLTVTLTAEDGSGNTSACTF
ncbi:HYR domain-containing protein, partial [Arthrospira platensis SPKY1]|nr:HYR domain-containing protein [Arthrospira platensis SPKY1]